MSFTEDQIRGFVRDELRKILDMGLMYTDSSKNAPQAKAAEQPRETSRITKAVNTLPEDTLQIPNLPGELAEKLKVNPDGTVQPIDFLRPKEVWEQINFALKQQGYRWVGAGKDSRWERR